METSDIIKIAALFAAGGIALWQYMAYMKRQKEKRRLEMLALADRMAAPSKPRLLETDTLEMLAPYKLLNRGHGQEIRNAFSFHKEGKEITVFDFHYIVGNSRNSRWEQNTAILLTSKSLAYVPSFSLEPDSFLAQIAHQLLGVQDINFPDRPVFSKQFKLQSGNEEATRRFFNTRLFGFFEQQPYIDIQTHDRSLLLVDAGSQLTPAERIQDLVDKAEKIHAELIG